MTGERGRSVCGLFWHCELFTTVKVRGREGRHTHTSGQLNSPEMTSVTACCGSTRLLKLCMYCKNMDAATRVRVSVALDARKETA